MPLYIIFICFACSKWAFSMDQPTPRDQFREFQKSIVDIVPQETKEESVSNAWAILGQEGELWPDLTFKAAVAGFDHIDVMTSLHEADMALTQRNDPEEGKIIFLDLDDVIFFGGRAQFIASGERYFRDEVDLALLNRYGFKNQTEFMDWGTEHFQLPKNKDVPFFQTKEVLEDGIPALLTKWRGWGYQIFGWTVREPTDFTVLQLKQAGIDFSQLNDLTADTLYSRAGIYKSGVMYCEKLCVKKGLAAKFIVTELTKRHQATWRKLSLSFMDDDIHNLFVGVSPLKFHLPGIEVVHKSCFWMVSHDYLSPQYPYFFLRVERADDLLRLLGSLTLEDLLRQFKRN